MGTEIQSDLAGLVKSFSTKRAAQEVLWKLQEANLIEPAGGDLGGEDPSARIRRSRSMLWETEAASKAFEAALGNIETELKLARVKSVIILAVALMFFLTFLVIVVLIASAAMSGRLEITRMKGLIAALTPLTSGSLFGWYLKLEKYRRDLGLDLQKLLQFVTKFSRQAAKSSA